MKLLLFILLFISGTSCRISAYAGINTIQLIASTPADAPILAMLGIDKKGTIDFIRWKLDLNPDNTFTATFIYGESKPNTLGFKEDFTHSLSGQYTKGTISIFTATSGGAVFRLLRLNDQLYHLLTLEGKMMVGNGGWSYSLNRLPEGRTASKELPALLNTARLEKDTATHFTFDGRTPCLTLAGDHGIAVRDGCFKLKWRLILQRDPVTLAPTTYTLKTINRRDDTVSGKWTIIKGISGQPNAVIYQLDADQPGQSLSFLVLDENVILFLSKDHSLYVGNGDFSYALNRNYLR